MEITNYKLTKVCDFQGGSQPPKKEWSKNKQEGYVRMLQIRDFTQTAKDNVEYVKDSNSIKKCKKDDVLIGRYGASIGKILTGLEGAYNVAIMKTIPNEKLLNKQYLLALLKAPLFQNFIKNIGGRAAQAGFNKEDLSKFIISLPSLDNQKRIAKVLSDCETLIERRKESFKLLDNLLESTFLEMFGDPVKNEKGWDKLTLDKLTKKIGSGSTPRGGKESYKEIGISLIRSLNVHDNKFLYKDLALIDNKQANKLKNVIVEKNDVLFNITGASVCRSTIVPENVLPARVNQHVSLIRTNPKKLNHLFLNHLLISKNFKKYLYKIATVNGATREAITKVQLQKLIISTPPIDIQIKFAKIAEKIEIIRQEFQIHLEELEKLYGSLSQLAFTGKLDMSNVLLRETKYFSTDINETPEDFKEQTDLLLHETELKPFVSKKELEKLKTKAKVKRDITDLSLADYYGIPLDIQAKRENIDFDFIGDDKFYQFLLKDHFKNESFTSQDLFKKLHNFFYHNGNMDFPHDTWKNIIFQFLDAKPPLLEQIYVEEDNTVKLKLTDEAYKA